MLQGHLRGTCLSVHGIRVLPPDGQMADAAMQPVPCCHPIWNTKALQHKWKDIRLGERLAESGVTAAPVSCLSKGGLQTSEADLHPCKPR